MAETATKPQPEQPQPKLADQSFVTYEGDPALLEYTEKRFAKYANTLTEALGIYETPSDTDTGAGQQAAGFFRHGRVDAVQNLFVPNRGSGPVEGERFSASFPSPREEAKVTVIESSEQLTLTPEGVTGPGCFSVSRTMPGHLLVFGNVVCIKGKISLPGRHIAIFARELRTLASGKQQAELNVDGANPAEPAIPVPPDEKMVGKTGTDAKFVYTSATDGDVTWPGCGGRGQHGKDGLPGDPGMPAGDIYILCKTLQPSSTLIVSAAGGAGQDGQRGQKGGKGGTGGKGWYGANYCEVHRTFVQEGRGGPGGFGGRGGLGGAGGDSGNCLVIFNDAIADDDLSQGAIKMVNRPGDSGSRGARGDDGDLGDPGQRPRETYIHKIYNLPSYPGYTEEPLPDLPNTTTPANWGRNLLVHNVNALSADSKENHPFRDLRGLARVSHLHMIMETARARYLAWDAYRIAKTNQAPSTDDDPIGGTEGDQADELKEELIALLEYLELGSQLLGYGSDAEKKVRDKISAALARWPMQVANGLDYFGNPDNFVPKPLGPPKIHLSDLTSALKDLETWEQLYIDYRTELAAQNQTQRRRSDTITAIAKWMDGLRSAYSKRRLELIGIVKEDIPTAQSAVATAKQNLQIALQGLTKWVEECFGLSAQDFIECLFNLAFCGSPVSEIAGGATEISKHGLFTMATTLTSQSAKLITKAVDTLPNDEGIPVNRKHLMRQIDTFSKKLDNLSEAYQMIQSALPSDPAMAQLEDKDTYRLLVVQREFDAMLDQFSTNPKAQAAVTAMDAYVEAVQARNAVLDDYNARVLDYLRIAADMHTTELQRAAVAELIQNDAKPNLPSETAFISALYNRRRENCIEYFYRASRSYSFWALSPDDSLSSTLQLGSINQIDYKLLNGATQQLLHQRTQDIRNNRYGDAGEKPPFHFPPVDGNYKGGGVYFPLEPGYALRLMCVANLQEITDKAYETVFVALVDGKLHIRIFDKSGAMVIDRPESQLLQSDSLITLKNCLATSQLNARESLDSLKRQWSKLDSKARQQLKLIGEYASSLTRCRLPYRLLLVSDDLFIPDKGANLVVIAVRGAGQPNMFRIRIFDDEGERAYINNDLWLSENEQAPKEKQAWEYLKKKLLPVTPKQFFPALDDQRKIIDKAVRLTSCRAKPALLGLLVASSIADIPNEARDSVIVAFVGTAIHIRIFDDRSNKVIDKNEQELAQNGPLLSELKELSRSVLGDFFVRPEKQYEFVQELAVHLNLADILGSPFYSYSLLLVPFGQLPEEGCNVVMIGLINGALRIRVFNPSGEKIVDLAEKQMLTSGADGKDSRQKITFLKNLLLQKKAAQEKIHESIADKREQEILSTAGLLAGYRLPIGYRKELAELRSNGKACFSIPPPAKDSTKSDNPFAFHCNVRLKRVRAWVDGIDNGFVDLQLRHKGPELMSSRDNSLIPFVHTYTEGRFKYEPDKVVWAKNKSYVENPEVALKNGVDGDFPIVRIDGDQYEYLRNIGPFTDWEITLTEGDKSKIKAIYLEFHGIAQSPD